MIPSKQITKRNRANAINQFNLLIFSQLLPRRFKAAFGKPVLTPVRRSVRLELVSTQHPPVVQEHDLTVRTLDELPEDVQQNLLFKPNFAVSAQLNEAWNELQLDL